MNPAPPAKVSLPTWPQFDSEQIEAAQRILASGKVNYWTGPEGREFEKEYAAYFGVKHAIALTNGTVAIDLALIALGIERGSQIVVTPRTFIASASAAILNGFDVVFADVDRDSGNITAESIERVLTSRTRAIIPVHLGGWPCDMPAIMDLANAKSLKVVEDCAQAHGASIDGRSVGTFGPINAWSFCQDKIITTAGEGGMVSTDDPDLWNRAWSYKDHGKSWDAKFNRQHAPGFRWEHESFGTNWRLTEIQSAIGRIQLHRLPGWVAQRRANAEVLHERLSKISGLRVPRPPKNIENAYYRFYAYLEPDVLRNEWTRDTFVESFKELGIPLFSGSCSEIYREKAFDGTGFRPAERLPVAQELGETSICFLVHPTLTDSHMHLVADAFEGRFARAKR